MFLVCHNILIVSMENEYCCFSSVRPLNKTIKQRFVFKSCQRESRFCSLAFSLIAVAFSNFIKLILEYSNAILLIDLETCQSITISSSNFKLMEQLLRKIFQSLLYYNVHRIARLRVG